MVNPWQTTSLAWDGERFYWAHLAHQILTSVDGRQWTEVFSVAQHCGSCSARSAE
jgi:hypothetical protein